MNLLSPDYPRAAWKVTLDGKDMAQRINPRLVSLSISEFRSDEVDQLNITLSDHDGLLAIPPLGAVLRVALGWTDSGLIDKGSFKVTEVTHSGAPDVVTIRGHSADVSGPLRNRTERSFHKKTIAQIVNEIAQANGLTAVVDKIIGPQVIQHIDQTNESDAAFLRRIGERYDAVATIKDGKLLFLRITGGRTAGGQEMPVLTLTRRDGDSHQFQQVGRDSYTGVRAFWLDTKKAKRHSVLVGVTGNAKQLRTTFANEADALAEAQAEWQRIQRGEATMRYCLAHGRPDLDVQMQVQFVGMKAPIGEITWLVRQLEHKLDDSGGLTTDVELETNASGDSDVVEMAEG